MGRSLVWGNGRRGSAAAFPSVVAVCAALLVVAADAPIADVFSGSPGLARAAADLAEAERSEREWLAGAAAAAWAGTPGGPGTPVERGRAGAEALRAAVEAHFPRRHPRAVATLLNATVSLPDGESRFLPPEVSLRVEGTLHIAHDGGHALLVHARAESADPTAPRGRLYLDRLLEAQAIDPRAAVGGALRAELAAAGAIGPEALDERVARAMAVAADQVQAEIAGAPLGRPQGPPAPPAPAAPADRQVIESVEEAGQSQFCRFVVAFLPTAGLTAGAAAAVEAAACRERAWRSALLAALADDLPALREALAFVAGLAAAAVEGAGAALARAARAFAWQLHNATYRAGRAVGALAPLAPASAVREPRVVVAFDGASPELSLTAVPSPAGSALEGTAARLASLELQLTGTARVFEGGRWVEATRVERATFVFPVGVVSGPADGPADLRLLSAYARAEPLVEAAGWIEDLRREVDRRLLVFRDAVSARLAASSATAVARIALRALEGLADGEANRTVRALFDLMERYFADDLRDALTFNFTFLGLAFRLVPDPVRQQVALEHSEGPHTFGARVRRVHAADNPLEPRWDDHLSLALEVYWRYASPPVSASVTVDPFLRTDEGLVRFALGIAEGEGLQVLAAAPRVVRRAGALEVSLSDFLPGGVPLAVTPSGGAVTVDLGARVEFLRTPAATLWGFIARAVGAAVLDVVANQSVGEVGEQAALEPLARALLGRFVARLGDTFADSASRFVRRADFFVRLRWAEAAGAVSTEFEAGLAVLEPVLVMRHVGAAAADLVHEAARGTRFARPGGPLDFLPSAVHERLGPSLTLRLRAGLAGVPLVGRLLDALPGAHLEQDAFVSLGALASAAGRRNVHWVCEYSVGFEGATSRALLANAIRLARGDGLEAAWVRVESLAGPRVLISEALPSPAGPDDEREFIELYNPGLVAEDLTGWALVDGSGRTFRLPDGTRIRAGGTLLVARSSAPFFARFGAAPDVSTLTLTLNDAGDRVRLLNAQGWVSDAIEWGEASERGTVPGEDESLARRLAGRAPFDLPGSALRYTGSWTDFSRGAPTPGRAALPA